MASYPWIVPHERQGQKLEDFPHLKRWFDAIKARPATVRAYELAKRSIRGGRADERGGQEGAVRPDGQRGEELRR